MAMPTDPRLAASLRRAAIHESAHGWVACAYGDPSPSIRIYLERGGYSGITEPTTPFPNLTAQRHVGLAGTVGVLLDHGVGADAIFGLLLAGELVLGPVDADMAAGYSKEDIRAVAALLSRNWDRVNATAMQLALAI